LTVVRQDHRVQHDIPSTGASRVSSLEKNTVRQLDGVEVERTFTDRASGKDTARPKLAEMLAFVREGDTVLVHSMDRLARSLEDLRSLVRGLTGSRSSTTMTCSCPGTWPPPWPRWNPARTG
jgi:Resolvase, N terminal domain